MKNTTLATTRRKAIAMMAVLLSGAPFLHAATQTIAGEERRWALDFRTRLEQPGAARPTEVHLSGEWILTVSAVRAGEYDAALQFSNVRIEMAAGAVPAEQKEQFVRRLARPFWATYRADGLLLKVHFEKDSDPSDRNLLQMIATESQFARSTPEQSSWSVLERDGAGEYEASYNLVGPNLVMKRRVKYMPVAAEVGRPSQGVPIQVEQSEFRFALDGGGGPAALDGKSRMRLGAAASAGGQLAVVTEIHLAGLRKSQSPEMIGSLARALPNVVSSPVRAQQSDPAQLQARMDNQLLEGRATETLLEAAFAPGKSSDALLQDRLAALFRQRPNATGAALEMLRKRGGQTRITDTLGAAGTPAALEVLGKIARDGTLPRPLRVDALSSFVVMQHPAAQTMRVPLELVDDTDRIVSSAARIASGALARAGRDTHPEESEKLDRALVARYRKAGDAAERSEILAAMGNSAGKTVVPVIEEALRDERDTVRATAARALRLAGDPRIEEVLATTILKDQAPGVRAAAIFAAGFRSPLGPKLGTALLQSAKSDQAEQIRTSAITLLRQHPGSAPNLAETLAWIAQHDPQEGVRRLARETLRSLPGPK